MVSDRVWATMMILMRALRSMELVVREKVKNLKVRVKGNKYWR